MNRGHRPPPQADVLGTGGCGHPTGHLRQDDTRDATLAAQRSYYASRRPLRMQVVDTAYVRRHFAEVRAACGIGAADAVCEWGAGLGRFSRQLAEAGLDLTAIELSPALAAECRRTLAGLDRASVETGDIIEVLERLGLCFDVMVGFFVLHHVADLAAYLAVAARRLRPGGRVAFAEPNPFHPLYPFQITLTPGMRWREEAGIYRLWPRAVRRAALAAGFRRVDIRRYGALPRGPHNALAAFGMERLPERFLPPLLRPFQAIVAWR